MKKIMEKLNLVDIIKASAVFVLTQIVVILIMTNFLFLINIEITKAHLPVSILINIIVFFLLYRKNENIIKYTAIALSLIIIFCSIFIVGKVYDTTADGNTYHKLAVGAMKNGWNPIYKDVVDFDIESGNPFDVSEDNVNINWVDHYPKASETFGAVLYSFTDNIESGKSYTIMLIYACFGIIFYFLYKSRNINIITSFLIAFVLTVNPITIVQLFNYYLDGALAMTLFLIFYSNFYIFNKDKYFDEFENFVILFSSIVICINLKFTGLAFAGIFCLAFYILYMVINFLKNKEEFKKEMVKYTIFYVVTVIISICVVGSTSYLRNMIDHGHPLYPLYGEGHVENMVVKEQPKSFVDKSNLEIFLISMFAKGVNVSPSYSDLNVQPELKIPFTFTRSELNNYSIPDIRMSGFGPLFSGIFIIGCFSVLYYIIKYIKEKNTKSIYPFLMLLALIFVLILVLDGTYWARYIPYVYMIPISSLVLLLDKKNKKYMRIIGYILLLLFLLNSFLVLNVQYSSIRNNDVYTKNIIFNFKQNALNNQSYEIRLNHSGLQGVLYNLDDLNINNYNIVKENENLKREGYFFFY